MDIVYRPAAEKAIEQTPSRDRDALKIKLIRFAETRIGDVVKMAGSDKWRLRHGD